jgi:hypothetical protein
VNAPHPEETHSLDAPSTPPAQPSDEDPIGLTEEELELVKAAVNGRSHAEPASADVFNASAAMPDPAPPPPAVAEAPAAAEQPAAAQPPAARRSLFGPSPATPAEAIALQPVAPQPLPEAEPVEASRGRMRQAWDEIQMAFPRLMGQPAYMRPRSLFSPAERPFDPDDLPLEAERSEDDRRTAEILATSAGTKERDGGGRGWRSVTRLLRLGD